MTLFDKLAALTSAPGMCPSAVRTVCEMNYLAGLSENEGHAYDSLIDAAASDMLAARERDGAVTEAAARRCEESLMALSGEAKKYRVHCVAHAHIDMNWQWGYHETAALTVDTFRTVLDLMDEYPGFTFGQSQASTYEIIEKFAPDMIPEIAARVREGRWEVTASTWVETDKNMPSGESLARHILYTKRYLSRLLGLSPDALALDFEPDTFGHNISVPGICEAGGVKYYYHCRGCDGKPNIYRWCGRDGSELLVYREPAWYNAAIDADCLRDTARLCRAAGTHSLLKVYGVGDHGGGPTRRDIERLCDMASWPLMPEIVFGTYGGFFAELEEYRDSFPVVTGELNFLFDGCYTSQSRIKAANRIAEDRMYESEALNAAAHFVAGTDFTDSFTSAWYNILFNQFHDILPGSGVIDTREYASGRFQDAMAAINTAASCSMREIAHAVDTSAYISEPASGAVSQGAGVGYGVGQKNRYFFPRAERGFGAVRIFHIFNTTAYPYDGVHEIAVFDWEGEPSRAIFTLASDGTPLGFTRVENSRSYWGHSVQRYAVRVPVPAFGYTTVVLADRERQSLPVLTLPYERTDSYTNDDIVLDNGIVRAVFDAKTMSLKSFRDVSDGRELVSGNAAVFRLITENTVHGMSAWRVGGYMKTTELNSASDVRVSDVNCDGVRRKVKYELAFGKGSKLTVLVTLDDGSRTIVFDTTVDFHETGDASGVPQLAFLCPLGYGARSYRYDVPFGTVDRVPFDYDVPASSFGAALREGEGSILALTSDSKYGFRGTADSLQLALIRASYSPDPYPEFGIHNFRIGLIAAPGADNTALRAAASAIAHPCAVVSARPAKGKLPPTGSFLGVAPETVCVSGIKLAEDDRRLCLRLWEDGGLPCRFVLTLRRRPVSAFICDVNEKPGAPLVIGETADGAYTVSGDIGAFAVMTLLIGF